MLHDELVSRWSSIRQIYGCFGESIKYDKAVGSSVSINPKFCAIGLAGEHSGEVIITPKSNVGTTGSIGKIIEKIHDDAILDLQWNPFNDNVLASCSADQSIKIWHVTDDLKLFCVRTLSKHFKSVEILKWHTTVDNVLLSYGADGKLILWNLVNEQIIFDVFEDSLTDIGFSLNASHIAGVSSVDSKLKILNSRTGAVVKSILLPFKEKSSIKVLFVTDARALTFGCSKSLRRQIIAYSVFFSPTPIFVIDIDDYIGDFYPTFDYDLKLLYIAGNNYSTLKCYELLDKHPWFLLLLDFPFDSAFQKVTRMPKRGLELEKCEHMRLYLSKNEATCVENVSFYVPVKQTGNQDIYPPTLGPTPATSCAEWLAGLDAQPILLELKPGFPVATSKPVELRVLQGGKNLVTSDLNNDRKFRFLSQVTKPDYRIIDEREDCEQIRLIEQVKQKLLSSTESFDTNEFEVAKEVPSIIANSDYLPAPLENSLTSKCEDDSIDKSCTIELENSTTQNTDICPDIIDLKEFEDVSDADSINSIHIDEVVELDCKQSKQAPIEIPEDLEPDGISDDEDRNSPVVKLISETERSDNNKSPENPVKSASPSLPMFSTANMPVVPETREKSMSITIPNNSTSTLFTPPPQFVERLHISSSPKSEDHDNNSSFGSSVVSECRLESMSSSLSTSRRRPVDEPIDVETNPFKSCFEDSITLTETVISTDENIRSVYKNIRASSSEEENGNDRKLSLTSDTSNSYSTDGQRLLENAINLLETHLSRSDNKVRQLERICELQQKDIDSLRYEIEWKDKRIEFLQKALVDMESRCSGSASPNGSKEGLTDE